MHKPWIWINSFFSLYAKFTGNMVHACNMGRETGQDLHLCYIKLYRCADCCSLVKLFNTPPSVSILPSWWIENTRDVLSQKLGWHQPGPGRAGVWCVYAVMLRDTSGPSSPAVLEPRHLITAKSPCLPWRGVVMFRSGWKASLSVPSIPYNSLVKPSLLNLELLNLEFIALKFQE